MSQDEGPFREPSAHLSVCRAKAARVDFKHSKLFLYHRIGAALTDALAVRCALADRLPS
jgi:hypothetical protein